MRNPDKKRCTALTASGNPCRNYAMPGSAKCRSHRDHELAPRGAGAPAGNQNRRTHGFYSKFLTETDLLDMATATGGDLLDEVAFTRVMVGKLSEMVGHSMEGEDRDVLTAVKLADALFRGVGRIALLLKAQKALSPDSADAVQDVIAGALDELGAQWDLDL